MVTIFAVRVVGCCLRMELDATLARQTERLVKFHTTSEVICHLLILRSVLSLWECSGTWKGMAGMDIAVSTGRGAAEPPAEPPAEQPAFFASKKLPAVQQSVQQVVQQ